MNEQKDERRAKGERSRKAILQAALATLAEKGLEGFTARTVARRAGFSTATVFHHFTSMDELQLDAMMLVLDEAMSARPPAGGADIRSYVETLGGIVFGMVREQPWLIHVSASLFAKLPFSEPLQRRTALHYGRYVEQIESELAVLGAAEGGPVPRHSLALALVLLLDQLSLYWMASHDVVALERFWRDMVALFTPALEGQGAR